MPIDQDRREDDEPGLLDEVADKLGFRARLKRNPALALAYRIAVGIVGGLIVVLGLALVPLPGPGWLIVFLGLGILATEFAWAERLLDFGRRTLTSWLHWLGRQNLAVRGLISLLTLAFVAGVVALALHLSVGLPFVSG
ncbi:MAG TPA: TIGR02611 family protein [Mycobacteriales bacterium]|nr:TIGR02611 family protein [Mycobacteriales bacterium]